jgi:PAS domain S-box-containing protein
MERIRRWIRRALPSSRVTIASHPAALNASLKRKDIGLALVQHPLVWGGQESPDLILKERRPGSIILWLAAAGVRPDLDAALRADVDGVLVDSPDLESELAFQLQLATRRGAARAALRDSESHDRSLLDRIPVGLYRISSQGEILNANAELVRMLGYPDREALTARKASELFARPTERQFLLDRQRGEPVVRAPEVEVRRADGGSLWVEDLARPLHDPSGKVVAYEGSLLDVTERRRLEAEIRASEERFRALVQNASDVIAVLDVRGEFTSLSPSVRTQLGYQPEELVGRSGFDLVHPDDLPLVRQAFGSVLQRTNPGTPTEYRFRHASGKWVGVESVASNMLDQPAVGGIVLTTRVITKRLQTEADLRESRRRLRTLLGNLPGMAYRCRNDREWTMELVSEGCLGLTGFPAADVQGNRVVSYASLIHPEDQAMVWDEVQAAVRQGRRFQLTYRIATAQGDMRWVWEQGSAVGTAPDGVALLEGFIADVTDRKSTEEDLRSSRAWLQHIVEAVDDLLVVYDEDGRYVDVIAGDDSLLMRPTADMLGRTVTDILPAETAQRFLTGIRIVLEQGASYDFEYPLDLPGGVRWFRARGRRIRASDPGRPLTLWSISDLTDRKATEKALLRQSRQLELLSRTSQQLNSVLEIPAVLRALVASGMDLVDAAAGTAGVWTDESMRFTEYNSDGLLQPIDSALALGEGVPGVVAETRKPYLANDARADRILATAGEDLGVRNLVNVPILSREGALLGCLEVHNKRRGEAFDEGDVSMLEGLASSAAVALENARLLEERLRAEEDLRRLKEFNEDMVQSMGEGIVVQDRMGRFTFVNPAAAAMLGYAPDELLGMPWTQVVPADQHAIVQEVDAAREAGGASRYELEFIRKDGRRLPALVSGNPRFEQGDFVGMLAVFADISDRKLAERALRESEEQLRSVTEWSPNMIFINQGGRIVYVNPQCSLMMGYSPEEFLSEGFRFESLVAPESMPVAREAFGKHTRGEDVAPYEFDLLTRQGRRLTVINATKLISFRGQPAILGVITDISQRKQAEQEVRRERDFSDAVLNSLPGIFYMYDPAGKPVRWNRQAETILGYSGEELSTMTAADFFVPADRKDVPETIAAVFASGSGQAEATLLTRDGREIPTYLTGVRATVGDQDYLVGVGIDIADRKRAEQALRESEARFRAFFAHAAIGIALVDQDGEIQEANAAFEAMLGHGELELRHQSQWDLMHPDDAVVGRRLHAEVCAGQRQPYQIEMRYRHRSGRMIDARLTVSLIPGPAAEPASSIWMVEDITERMRAEGALRESERRFRLLVERAADAVFLHDLQGAVVDVNQQACESLGYTRDELLRLHVGQIEAEVPEDAQRDLWLQVTKGAPRTLEGVHRRKDGSTFPVELRIGGFDIDGRPYILSLARDITERRKGEEALRETSETLQALVHAAPVGVTVLDLEGRVRLWNPGAERMFGVPSEAVLDQPLNSLRALPAEIVDTFAGVLRRVLAGEIVSGIEVRSDHASGEPLDVSVSAAPLRDSAGRIQAVMGLLADVTDRKRAEAGLERHAREMSVLYETSLEVAETGDAMQILRTVLIRAADLLGAPMGGVYLMDDAAKELELAVTHNLPAEFLGLRLRFGEGLSGKIAESGEAMAVNDYGAWEGRHAGYDGAGFRRVLGAPLRRGTQVIGVINITDDRRTDPFEQDEIRILQLFADQAAIALENARLLEETSRRAAHLQAVTSVAAALRATRLRGEIMPVILSRLEELIGAQGALLALEDRATREIVVPLASGVWSPLTGTRQADARGVFGEVMATGKAALVPRVEDEVWAQLPRELHSMPAVALVPLVEQEEVIGLLGVGRKEPFGPAENSLLMALAEVAGNALHRAGVLETLEQRVQVRTRELAEANDRLKELDRLKSNFVSNVSHELRTPITNVLLYLDLLQQPGREERRETYMQVLRREAGRLGHLIEDLLTLSRMDQAALKINRELRALDPLLAEVVTAHRARAQAKEIELRLEPNPEVPPLWIGYQPMIQVFNNLVGNAVAYTPAGGHVTLSGLVRQRLDGVLEVGARVWNDGPPIPADDLPQLFQRFYRGKTGRESGEPGTGLGLAICKEIVDRHGGRIDVRSSPEHGTSFTVWLPVGEPA